MNATVETNSTSAIEDIPEQIEAYPEDYGSGRNYSVLRRIDENLVYVKSWIEPEVFFNFHYYPHLKVICEELIAIEYFLQNY